MDQVKGKAPVDLPAEPIDAQPEAAGSSFAEPAPDILQEVPDILQEVSVGDGPPAMAHEVREQVEIAPHQWDAPAGATRSADLQVELEVSDPQDCRLRGPRQWDCSPVMAVDEQRMASLG